MNTNKHNEEKRIDRVVKFWMEIPLLEHVNPEIIQVILDCEKEWGNKTIKAQQQTANFLKVTFSKEIKKFALDQPQCFDELIEK